MWHLKVDLNVEVNLNVEMNVNVEMKMKKMFNWNDQRNHTKDCREFTKVNN